MIDDECQKAVEEEMAVFGITDALNTYDPALAALKQKGYSLYYIPDHRPQQPGEFKAIQNSRVFTASDPLRLLGLVGIWETFGADWRHLSGIDLETDLMTLGLAIDDFSDMENMSLADLNAYFSELFGSIGLPPSDATTREELGHRVRGLNKEIEESG